MRNPSFKFFQLNPYSSDVIAARQPFPVGSGSTARQIPPIITIHRSAEVNEEAGRIVRPAEVVDYIGRDALIAIRAAIDHALGEATGESQ